MGKHFFRMQINYIFFQLIVMEVFNRPKNISKDDYAKFLNPFGYKLFPWPDDLKNTIGAKIDLIFYRPDLVPPSWPLNKL